MRFNTAASTLAFVVNSVQASECLQLAVTGRGSSPLDDLVPARFRRLAAALQLPILLAVAAGELAKVRRAFDAATRTQR